MLAARARRGAIQIIIHLNKNLVLCGRCPVVPFLPPFGCCDFQLYLLLAAKALTSPSQVYASEMATDYQTTSRNNIPSSLFLGLAGTVLIYVLTKVVHAAIGHFASSLRDLPGPPSSHWLFGNFHDINANDGTSTLEEWMTRYGKVIRVRTVLNVSSHPPVGRDHLYSLASSWVCQWKWDGSSVLTAFDDICAGWQTLYVRYEGVEPCPGEYDDLEKAGTLAVRSCEDSGRRSALLVTPIQCLSRC